VASAVAIGPVVNIDVPARPIPKLMFLLLRPLLHIVGFAKFFSNASVAEFSLYVAIFGLLGLFF
jgi:hypothetical protein